MRTRGDVRFAANDRFDSGALRFLVKFDRAIQIAVIGHRDRGHLEFSRFFHQLFHPDRAIEQRIFGVQMQVNERVARHLLQFQYKRQQRSLANLPSVRRR